MTKMLSYFQVYFTFVQSHTYKLIPYIHGSIYLFFLPFNVNTFLILITLLVVPQPLLFYDLLCYESLNANLRLVLLTGVSK